VLVFSFNTRVMGKLIQEYFSISNLNNILY
jgi:hypothetical protein